MDASILTNKINLLPEEVQKQVADFVEFLIIKYQNKNGGKAELTAGQKKKFLQLWKGYEANPDNVISMEALQEQTSQKYSL